MLGLAVLEGIANLNRMVWKVLLLALLFRLLSDGRSYDVGKAKARCKQFVCSKKSVDVLPCRRADGIASMEDV
jgi:hypothetical protein